MNVVVLLLHNGLASTAITPVEIFQSAGRLWNELTGDIAHPCFRVRCASIDGGPVQPDGPFTLKPHAGIADIENPDLIVVPATGLPLEMVLELNRPLIPWLQKWHRHGAGIAGICTGVSLLAEAGLLEGREATTHWGVVEEFRERYPGVLWKPELFTTDAEGVCCGGGVYASVDLSLYLVEKHAGREVAVNTAKALLIDRPRTYQSGYSAPLRRAGHNDEKVLLAQRWLHEHYRDDVQLRELAKMLGMSPRNFARRFSKATGQQPLAYLQQLRIEHSKSLLEKDYGTIQEVADSVGYGDLIFFRRLFKRYTGLSPQAYRQRFGTRTTPSTS